MTTKFVRIILVSTFSGSDIVNSFTLTYLGELNEQDYEAPIWEERRFTHPEKILIHLRIRRDFRKAFCGVVVRAMRRMRGVKWFRIILTCTIKKLKNDVEVVDWAIRWISIQVLSRNLLYMVEDLGLKRHWHGYDPDSLGRRMIGLVNSDLCECVEQ